MLNLAVLVYSCSMTSLWAADSDGYFGDDLSLVSAFSQAIDAPSLQSQSPIYEPLGAEEIHAEDDSPRIPEPMVFDLVRPLGARKGEAEINVLSLIPYNRRVGKSQIPDAIGLVPGDRHRMEWAPEIEMAIWDGVAVEFELPFEESSLAAYKSALQVTFGTAFENHFIHGAQVILLYDTHSKHWSPTLLYLAGVQFDEKWSALGMLGIRTEIDADDRGDRTERIVNLTIFRHLNEHSTAGVETIYLKIAQREIGFSADASMALGNHRPLDAATRDGSDLYQRLHTARRSAAINPQFLTTGL